MFETVQPAPPDAILGINEAFVADPNPRKINLSVGVYRDAAGQTPILESVRQIQRQILDEELSKNYLSITGNASFGQCIPPLVFGNDYAAYSPEQIATVQTPGGTGGLRVAADFIRATFPQATIWVSDPTWPNHPHIFSAAGLQVKTYPYYDPQSHGLNVDAMFDGFKSIPAGDVVLLHGCCHNPTGVDLTPDHWDDVGQILQQQGVLPLVDFAYQGFGTGLNEDAVGVRRLSHHTSEMIVCSSFSKNFGLYNERVGSLSLTAAKSSSLSAVVSQVKQCIRRNYSNPPAHGAAIVTGILTDPVLRASWESELAEMRTRINTLRQFFSETMKSLGSKAGFEFLTRQRGMFSYSGLSPDQVDQLRSEHAIYMVRNGRMNVAGMNRDNVPYICEAVHQVMRQA